MNVFSITAMTKKKVFVNSLKTTYITNKVQRAFRQHHNEKKKKKVYGRLNFKTVRLKNSILLHIKGQA